MDNKYEQELKNSERLENSMKNLNELVIELKIKVILNYKRRKFKKFQIKIKIKIIKYANGEQCNDSLRNENLNLNQQVQNKNYELKKMSQENEGLNNDLEKVNEEYSKLMHCLSQTENNLKSMQNKLNEKIEEVLNNFISGNIYD